MNHSNWSGCLSLNAGDALTPWMIERCGDRPAVYIENPKGDCPHYLCAGSILNHMGPKSEVWGAGLAAWTNDLDKNATIYAVRGPLSALCARSNGCEVPDVYGDPGLCVTKLDPICRDSVYSMGLIPHYNDFFRVHDLWIEWGLPVDIKVINILQPIEKVLEDISACRKIISSSLHGLVFAQSLGVPFRWVDFGGNIGGNGLKYWDFLASVGLANLDRKPNPVDLTGELVSGNVTSIECQLGNYDPEPLWNACPFKD